MVIYHAILGDCAYKKLRIALPKQSISKKLPQHCSARATRAAKLAIARQPPLPRLPLVVARKRRGAKPVRQWRHSGTVVLVAGSCGRRCGGCHAGCGRGVELFSLRRATDLESSRPDLVWRRRTTVVVARRLLRVP